ncbi:MAG TPA: tail fiber domain-containing protein [Phycisphaerales bacterium]|nr:tail fiber domain-containing protein [Phycisphaerales bacterium]
MMQLRAAVKLAAASLVSLVASAGALGQTFSNPAPITIPDSGVANPYPSIITVAGGPASIQFVTVTLHGLAHTFFEDLDMLLVAPGGQKILLSNDPPGAAGAPGITFNYISAGGASQGGGLANGGYYAPTGGNDPFPAPAPAGPYAANFNGLTGTNANGQWRLFVVDDAIGDLGSIAGGWSITFSAPYSPPTPLDSSFTYQGVLKDSGGVPITGNADVRFAVWDAASGLGVSLNSLGSPVTVNNVPVTDGLFTANVNLGNVVPTDRKSWVEIEVASPPGSAFVKLSPRQPLSSPPLAVKVASSPFSAGALVGNSGNIGANQHDPLNRGVKTRTGWAIDRVGLTEFAGMQTIIEPGTFGCGNSSDLAFFTWECNRATSREIMRINGSGNVGIGTAAPLAKLDVTTGAIGAGWQTVWNNTSNPSFRGGARLADNGFFEMTNNANIAAPNFARLASTGAWTAVSDGRLKTDVSPIQNQLATAMKLKPVAFRWKATGAADFGLIAQDVRGVLPTLVVGDEGTESLTVNYSQLSVVAIGAIQEQQREIETLRDSAARQEADNAKLQARIEQLEAAIRQMQGGK